MPSRDEACLCFSTSAWQRNAPLAVNGGQRVVQMLGGVPEGDDLLDAAPAGQRAEIRPVVLAPAGDGAHAQVGPWRQRRDQFLGECALERDFAGLGHAPDPRGVRYFPRPVLVPWIFDFHHKSHSLPVHLLRAETKSAHLVQDLVGGVSPLEGLAFCVVRFDVGEDGRPKLGDARVRAALERLLSGG
jgi:hypothetical protein